MRTHAWLSGLLPTLLLLAWATITSGQTRNVAKLFEDAMGEDPEVAERAVQRLAKQRGTEVLLAEIAERPGGERYYPVRMTAINALLQNPDEDLSPTVASMLRTDTPLEMRLAIADALERNKCGRGCVMEVYGHIGDLWAAERHVRLGLQELPTSGVAAMESSLKNRLLDILRKEKLATVELASALHTLSSREMSPSPFVIWLADRLEIPEFCPLLVSFSKAAKQENEREQIHRVIRKLNCNTTGKEPLPQP